MPAAAVIPAPEVYGFVAETITFVVGVNGARARTLALRRCATVRVPRPSVCEFTLVRRRFTSVTQSKRSKRASARWTFMESWKRVGARLCSGRSRRSTGALGEGRIAGRGVKSDEPGGTTESEGTLPWCFRR